MKTYEVDDEKKVSVLPSLLSIEKAIGTRLQSATLSLFISVSETVVILPIPYICAHLNVSSLFL